MRAFYHFLSRIREALSLIQVSCNKILLPVEIEDLHLCICLLHKAEASILINLVVDRETTVHTISDARKRVMGGYTSQGICWCNYLKEHEQGKLTLNLIEFLPGVVTVELVLVNLPEDTKFPFVESLLNSTGAIIWIDKSNFLKAKHLLHIILARYLADLLIFHDACFHARHIPGLNNTISD